MGTAPARRPAGPGGDGPAGQPGQQVGDLVGGPAQIGHQRVCDPAKRRAIVGFGHPPPSGQALDPGAALGLDPVDVPAGSALHSDAQLGPDGGTKGRYPGLGQPGDGQHVVHELVTGRHLTQNMEATADLGIFEGAQVAVHMQQQIVELVVAGRRVPQLEIAVDLRLDEQLPYLGPQARELVGVHQLDLGVGVKQLFEPEQFVIGVSPHERRGQMVDDHGMCPPFGLGPLARVVDHEGIEEGEIGDGRIGKAAGRRRQ